MTTRVFVAWDSQLHQVAHTFDHLAGTSKDPKVVILGRPGGPALGELRGKLKASLEDSDALLAIVDTPNANMTWELGYALCRRLRIAIATESSDPAWVNRTPLETVLRNQGVHNLHVARGLLACVHEWPVPDAFPGRGARRILLVPSEGAGGAWREVLEEALPGWILLDTTGWKPSDLPARLAGADRVAWVLLPLTLDQKEKRGHGQANAVGALVAGYATAAEMAVRVFSCVGAPRIADVVEDGVDFVGAADLVEAVRALALSRTNEPVS